MLTEKYRRAVITCVQNLLGGTFLQFASALALFVNPFFGLRVLT